MPDSDAATANRTLFHLGHELPGDELRAFAKRLLLGCRTYPGVPAGDLVRQAISDIGGGIGALASVEPDLRLPEVGLPAAAVEAHATAEVTALGHRLVAAYRKSATDSSLSWAASRRVAHWLA